MPTETQYTDALNRRQLEQLSDELKKGAETLRAFHSLVFGVCQTIDTMTLPYTASTELDLMLKELKAMFRKDLSSAFWTINRMSNIMDQQVIHIHKELNPDEATE